MISLNVWEWKRFNLINVIFCNKTLLSIYCLIFLKISIILNYYLFALAVKIKTYYLNVKDIIKFFKYMKIYYTI